MLLVFVFAFWVARLGALGGKICSLSILVSVRIQRGPWRRLYAYSERKDLARWKFKTNQHWFWADRPTEDLNPWINLIGK